MKAVNWNKQDDTVMAYWKQNVMQFWLDDEFNVSKDIPTWNNLTGYQQDTYKKALAGLTGLDTQQNDLGMPLIAVHTNDDLRKQAVYMFVGAMEGVHAKSYSTIFTSLIPSSETDYLLDEYVPNNEYLQYKGRAIARYYQALLKEEPSNYELYMARVASVFLESFIFYSGFFYPLYLAGQGICTTSGEIIRKILLDETIHGSFVGWDAQGIYEQLSEYEQKKADEETHDLLINLYRNEVEWTKSVYDQVNLTEEVLDYVKYNANRALMNLGKEPYFEHCPVNPIIENAMNTTTKNHDFFSVKGDGYVVSTNNSDQITDDDFNF